MQKGTCSKLDKLQNRRKPLVQLLPNPFPSKLVTLFFTKMVKSDLAVTFSYNFDHPKYVVIIHSVSTITLL